MERENEVAIDQKYLDKQSRTIGTYGLETMAKLIAFKVVIVGCGGVGIEVAKNLALAGIHTIRLYDPRTPTVQDVGVNFAVTEQALSSGNSVAALSASYIQELNPNTRVRAIDALTEDYVKDSIALIFTAAAPDLSLTTLNRWNDFCRRHTPTVSFVLAMQLAACGSVFADHGPSFTVRDADGRPMLQKSITEVVTLTDKTGEKYTRIRYETPEGQTPGALRDYTQIKLSEVRGLVRETGESVNGQVFDGVVCPTDPRDTVRVYPAFETRGYRAYETGGFLHELKEVTHLSFRPLKEALVAPGAFVPVSPMMDNSEESETHLILYALLRYADQHQGHLPQLHSQHEAEEVVRLAKLIQEENKALPVPTAPQAAGKPEKVEFPYKLPPPPPPVPLVLETFEEKAVLQAALLSRAELQPLSSFFGAVVAQEVVKITGKYSPMHQWFHLSCAAVLPSDADYSASNNYHPIKSRYDHIIALFGKEFQQQLANLRVFMVGCGALGCENIKNFALCGITCGPNGSLVVTDNDRIEVSNLSRQFLFREENVGQSKSAAAAARMRQMNPDCKVDPRQDYVGATTEHVFPDTFWQSLDVVVNALDNMETRLYVDQQCVRFHKVLVEAGTMGTGGNVDIIVPGRTSSYADGGAADQTGGIPMCTLRNFPYIYDHCIEWGRALFDDMFVSPMQTAQQVIEDPTAFTQRITHEVSGGSSAGERRSLIAKNLGSLKSVKRTLSILVEGPTMAKCAALGWDHLFRLFRDRILDLQVAFPRDAKKKNGEPFWSGHRKYPSALDVAPATVTANPDARNFLVAATNLYACMFGVHPPKPEARFNDDHHRWMEQYRTDAWVQAEVRAFAVPPYVAGSVDDLEDDLKTDAQESKEVSVEEAEAELQELLREVAALATKCKGSAAGPLEFEKDDDDNFQIDFVAAASNLRAENYDIPPQDRMKVKLVAGKIIPAIATTTSAVTGLALIELFKVLQNKDMSALRNGMLDVGTNNYVLFERDAPVRNRTKVVSTYLPEQDYTYRKKIIRVPEGYTKYDMIRIPITPATTVADFAKALEVELNKTLPEGVDYRYEVDGLGVGTGLLWNGRPSHPSTNASLMEVIERQKNAEANGKLTAPFWQNRVQFCDLSVTVSIDDGDDAVDEVDVETATVCLVIQ
ncbi:putative mitochondrial ubiquitin-activating enzyme e1 [Leptomonas pyrrhocoris]|uniref:Ubiquitin-like 1-activating enzyme E1A n=1 Tax=Leptomonas pyrrhocoris TaxID=157538 RepID=A0A0N0VHW5_LEPPY|nr:putative mitochondrial ubiquitin-activating enzyme e1 [Leptomonas pyrrhocoris]KPA86321.1 putative mitochondrial ubiquitin-activating enzyme e1 [Leptomonas pyrrhocoris]|eukprot:XP_015664760.1 putative mitochondrial ubiquitin-activating enzyme e1 [Leptomonas pyrrhocoris]